MSLIEVKGLKKSFGSLDVLKGIDLSVEQGERIAIIGGSGCGKSVFLRSLCLLEKPDAGQVFIDGQEITAAKGGRVDEIRRSMGMVFQKFHLFSEMDVMDNLCLAPMRLKGVSRQDAEKKAMDLLRQVGLASRAHAWPTVLSGGQQQRIAIARAIVNEPKVLLLDEPLGALDLKLRQEMQYELMRLKNELGITFVYVTHDQEEALTMSDTIVVMNQGYIQQVGTPEDIYNEPQNAFVADFIGDSNILDGIMIKDKLVEILGAKFPCVDTGFGVNKPVDVVIRPEDVELVKPDKGIINGRVTSVIFKGVNYEMDVECRGYEWLVHSTRMVEVGKEVGIDVDPFNIQIMNKPESEDEEAAAIEE